MLNPLPLLVGWSHKDGPYVHKIDLPNHRAYGTRIILEFRLSTLHSKGRFRPRTPERGGHFVEGIP